MRLLRLAAAALVWLALIAVLLWALLAFWFDGPAAERLRLACMAALALAAVAIAVWVRPAWRAALALAIVLAGVLVWWNRIPPRNDRDWMTDVARLPRAIVAGNVLTVENVRDFDYRSETDFDERWETRTYDLSRLEGADLFLSYWGPTLIAHTIATWDFDDGQHLAISIETRKEKGESYSALRGFFRQYELYYVVADERDVIGVRAVHRGETVYLYRIRMSANRARALLLDYLKDVNEMVERPKWYNALTHNCTTTIRDHVQHVSPAQPWAWQILANGYLDQLAYQRRTINTSLPFGEMRARSDVTEKAKAASSGHDFSARIRDSLPERPGR